MFFTIRPRAHLHAALAAVTPAAPACSSLRCKRATGYEALQSSTIRLLWLYLLLRVFFPLHPKPCWKAHEGRSQKCHLTSLLQPQRPGVRGQGLCLALSLQKLLYFLLHSHFTLLFYLQKWNRAYQTFKISYDYISNPAFDHQCGCSREGRCYLLFYSHCNALEAQSEPGFEHRASCSVQVLYDLLRFNQRAHHRFVFNIKPQRGQRTDRVSSI